MRSQQEVRRKPEAGRRKAEGGRPSGQDSPRLGTTAVKMSAQSLKPAAAARAGIVALHQADTGEYLRSESEMVGGHAD